MTDLNKPPTPDEQPATGNYASPPPPPGAYGTPPPPPPYGAPGAGAPVTDADERLWATLGHVGGILIYWISGLIVYLIYKDRSQYLKQQGAEALNFQITIVILWVAWSIVIGIGSFVTFGLATLVWWLPFIPQLVFGIIAGVAANKHENYRYPFAIRFIK